MANIVRDPKEHPDAILPDFTKADPLLTFQKQDVVLVYGSIWKQRYFTKVGNDYYPEGVTWDLTHHGMSRFCTSANFRGPSLW